MQQRILWCKWRQRLLAIIYNQLQALPVIAQGFFVNLLAGKMLEELVDFNELSGVNAADIPARFIAMVVNKKLLKSAADTGYYRKTEAFTATK